MRRHPGFQPARSCKLRGGHHEALEQLCRYITRLALSNERVQCNAAGQVVLKLKTPWHDNTRHLMMSPLKFILRLAPLFPWRRRPAATLFVVRPRKRLLCGDQLRAANVAATAVQTAEMNADVWPSADSTHEARDPCAQSTQVKNPIHQFQLKTEKRLAT